VESKIDLDETQQREILALEAKVDSPNLFEILGVPVGADAEVVRAAFREASRKFHPDRFFGKNLGSFKAKLERVFRRLVEANNTLTDATKRQAYLAAFPSVMAGKGTTATNLALQPVKKSAEEEAREAERRARLARHPYLAKAAKVQELLGQARAELERGEYSLAITHLNNATQFDPNNAEVKLLLGEARKKADTARADANYAHGMQALERGEEDKALQLFRSAVNISPHHHQAAYQASLLGPKRGLDPKEAIAYAQKAVDGDARNVEYRLQLAKLLGEAGMKALARKHYEEASRLDPGHPEVKKHVRRLWPF
jgi:curved DNA-binding protein CbpA